jgi:pSer/pThr/pTyr-binding forkhead associated (FHA) protein
MFHMVTVAHLAITEAGRPDRTIAVRGTTTIGRDNDNDIVLESISVSRCHAMLFHTAAGLLLIDLESTNGTLVNRVLVRTDAPVRLAYGDVIQFGQVLARYAAVAKRSNSEPLECLADQVQHLRLSAAETRCALPKGR